MRIFDLNQNLLKTLPKNTKNSIIYYFEVANKANSAHALQDLGQLEKALIYNEVALTMLQRFQKQLGEGNKNTPVQKVMHSIDCKMLEAQILNNISSIFIDLNKFEEALERAFRAVEINQKLYGNSINTEIATNLMNISIIYQHIRNFDEAIIYAKRAQEMFEKMSKSNNPQIKKQWAICLGNMGYLFQAKDKYFEALLHYKKALDIMIQVEEKSQEIAGLYFNLSSLYQMEGDLDKGLDYAKQAQQMYLDLFKDDKHPTLIDIYDHIGELLSAMKKYEESLDYFDKSYNVRKDQDPCEAFMICLSNIVHNHQELNNVEDVKGYGLELKELEKKLRDKKL